MKFYLSANLSIYLLVSLPTILSFSLSGILSVCPSLCVSFYLSVSSTTSLFLSASVAVSLCASVFVSLCAPVFVYLYASVCMSTHLCMCTLISQSISLFIYLSYPLSFHSFFFNQSPRDKSVIIPSFVRTKSFFFSMFINRRLIFLTLPITLKSLPRESYRQVGR